MTKRKNGCSNVSSYPAVNLFSKFYVGKCGKAYWHISNPAKNLFSLLTVSKPTVTTFKYVEGGPDHRPRGPGGSMKTQFVYRYRTLASSYTLRILSSHAFKILNTCIFLMTLCSTSLRFAMFTQRTSCRCAVHRRTPSVPTSWELRTDHFGSGNGYS